MNRPDDFFTRRSARDVKSIVGNFSASRQSALRMCLSRFSLAVFSVVTSMDAVTDDAWRFSATVIVPVGPAIMPRAIATVKCSTVNSA